MRVPKAICGFVYLGHPLGSVNYVAQEGSARDDSNAVAMWLITVEARGFAVAAV